MRGMQGVSLSKLVFYMQIIFRYAIFFALGADHN